MLRGGDRTDPNGELPDPDPFSIGLGIFGIIAAGGSFLETRRARQIVERQQRDQFRATWFACRRTLIHFKRVVDEFETYVLEDNYGRDLFRIGSVRITVDQNRHHALRRLHGQVMTTATFMADNLDDLSDHLGAADQSAVDTLLATPLGDRLPRELRGTAQTRKRRHQPLLGPSRRDRGTRGV